MPYVRIFRFVTLLLLIVGSGPKVAFAAEPKSAAEAFRLDAQPGEEEGIEFNWSIAPGHYLYRERIAATLNGKALRIVTARGELKDDPTFGPTEIYRSTATALIAGDGLPEAGEVLVTYQGCAENIICYPPITKVVNLATLLVSDPPERAAVAGDSPDQPASRSQSDEGGERGILGGGYVPTLAAFFGFGLLLSLTPCVFPMIPILSGMLAGAGPGLSIGRSLALSGAYVLAMATAYGVLGVFAAWSGENLQVVLQTPAAVLLMSLTFLGLALSMFGLFELRLPQTWFGRLAGVAGNRGPVGRAALLGFGSALIVGPCVTPPLAAALVFVAQTGNAVRGSSALFALGLGMGLPLLALGVLGARVLPRSGPWLVTINRVFGIVFVVLAVWMASRVLPVSLIAADWGALFAGLGIYVATTKIATRLIWRRAAVAAIGATAMIYGCVLLIGAAIGMYEPLRPLASLGLIASAATPNEEQGGFLTVSNESDLDTAIAAGNSQGRLMLIDFSADWCTECKVMERSVFSQAIVRQQLRGILLIRADLTHFDQASKNLMKRFAVVGPPTMIFLKPGGTEIPGARIVGGVGTDGFLSRIAKALRA